MMSRKEQPALLPDFIAVGVGRSGTSWLHQVLKGRVGLPRGIKETDFFLRNYSNGLQWYQSFFRDCAPERPIGEICPTYFSSADARQRINLHIPDCRIICTFREPVARAFSHYKLMRHNVWTRVNFEEAVGRYREISEMNRYAFHLKRWLEGFGREQVLVCLYDDLENDPQTYLDRICTFIGIPSFQLAPEVTAVRVNSFATAPRNRRLAQNARHARDWLRHHRAYRLINLLERAGAWRYCFEGGERFAPLEPEVERRLKQKFRLEVDALEELIGRDLSSWKLPNQDDSAGAGSRVAAEPLVRVKLEGTAPLQMALFSRQDRISREIARTGQWEPFETALIQQFLRPGDVFVDIGANIGWYTIIAAARVGGSGRVYAFEPAADNFALARRNVALNHLDNVTVERLAVAERAGQAALFLSADNRGDHRLYESAEQRLRETVPVTSLAEYFKPQTPIRLIKMDTQGSEARIFAGMPDNFIELHQVAGMVVEYWPFGLAASGSTADALLGRFAALGLQCYLIDEAAGALLPVELETLRERAYGDLHPRTEQFVNLLLRPVANPVPDWMAALVRPAFPLRLTAEVPS